MWALGTFIAGNYSSGGWRISLVGFQLALGVPAVAWLEQSTLLLVLVGGVLIGLAVMVFRITLGTASRTHTKQRSDPQHSL